LTRICRHSGDIVRVVVGGAILALSAAIVSTGAEVVKTEEQAAIWGGVAEEQFDPCYHEASDTFVPVASSGHQGYRTRRSRRCKWHTNRRSSGDIVAPQGKGISDGTDVHDARHPG
jgi:hypothetical protein